MEATRGMENLEKKSGATDESIKNIMQGKVKRISGVEDTLEDIGTTVKENSKNKKHFKPKTSRISWTQ